MKDRPKISIGLYIFNAEKYVRQAIESILRQTEGDLELVISDNASTDQTPEICQSFDDPRIRFYSSEVNRGASWNHTRVFELSRGEYFKWAAYDDVLHPDFLASCVEVLERDPDAVLAYTDIEEIDSEGRIQSTFSLPVHPTGRSAHLRFAQLILLKHACQHVFGLMRREVLKKTDLIGPSIGSDRVFLAQLSLLGRFAHIPRPLFIWRHHREQTASLRGDPRLLAQWFDTSSQRRFYFPNWKYAQDYWRLANCKDLDSRQRNLTRLWVCLYPLRHSPRLGIDLLRAVRILASPAPKGSSQPD